MQSFLNEAIGFYEFIFFYNPLLNILGKIKKSHKGNTKKTLTFVFAYFFESQCQKFISSGEAGH